MHAHVIVSHDTLTSMNFQAAQGDLTNAHAAVRGSHMSVQSNCPKGAVLRTLYNSSLLMD